MTSTLHMAILAIGAGFLALMGVSGFKDLARDDPVGMRLIDFRYEDGQFHQHHEIFGRASIIANWAAKVTRDGEIICSGGGVSSYAGGPVHMGADHWVGDDCPELQAGDIAQASWEWKTSKGLVEGISATLTIE